VISNGGWGGVLESLARGVPMIVAGGDRDKPEVAARVGFSGAGVNMHTGRPSARAVAAAYARVAGDPGYRARAQAVAAELDALGGTARAIDLVEQVLVDTP